MSEFEERPAGWVPLEGGGAWVPAGSKETSGAGPVWPQPATTNWGPSAPAVTPPPPPPSAGRRPRPAEPAPGGPGGFRVPGPGPTSPPPAPTPKHRRALPVVLATASGRGSPAWPGWASVTRYGRRGRWSTPAPRAAPRPPNNSGSTGSGSTGSGSAGSRQLVRSVWRTSGNCPLGPAVPSGNESPFGSGSGNNLPSGPGLAPAARFRQRDRERQQRQRERNSTGSPSDTAAIAAKVSPALVDINSTFGYQSAQGAGTGIVLTSNGEILTNNHVINGATKISVTDVGNGKTYSATVVGYDDSHDIAVLQLQGASGLQTAKIGDSSTAAVGEGVVAIGNAGGTGGTPSYAGGSITALNQSITASDDLDGASEQLTGLIQINANIQPGDSGGLSGQHRRRASSGSTPPPPRALVRSHPEPRATPSPSTRRSSIAHQIESGQGSTTDHVGATAFLGVELSSGGQGSQGSGQLRQRLRWLGLRRRELERIETSGRHDQRRRQRRPGGPGRPGGRRRDHLLRRSDRRLADRRISTLLVGHHPGDKVQIGWVDSSGQSHTATVDLGSGPPA